MSPPRTSAQKKRFVVLSGFPGSGKSTLARQLAPALHLPLIDKDFLLEDLFECRGVGDAEWRRFLSRESDLILQSQAIASDGAVLVSFWHQPGMPSHSGTPIDWLLQLSDHVVNVHCVCSAELAAERFFHRKRHPGHLDSRMPHSEVLATIRATEFFGPLDIGQQVDVDTSQSPILDLVLRDIDEAFKRCINMQ